MTPFGLLAAGIAVVFFDFRINGFDVLVDVVGWSMSGYALARLEPRSANFSRAKLAAVVGGVLSLAEVIDLTAVLGETVSAVTMMVSGLAQTAVAYCVCSGVIDVMSSPVAGDADRRWGRTANRIRWCVGVAGLFTAAIPLFTRMTTVTLSAIEALPVIVVLLGIGAWFFSLLLRLRDHPELQG